MLQYNIPVAAVFLGLYLPLSLSRELRHTSIYTSTENEFELEFSKEGRIKASESVVDTKTLFVGGFQLATGDEFTGEACGLIEDQFVLRTDCTCSLSTLHSSTVQFGCKNENLICNEKEYCAQPVYTGILGYEKSRISTDFCLNNLQRDGKTFGNLCVAIDGLTRDTNLIIRRCLAQVGKQKCDCTICGEGGGLRVDCTNIDSRLISRRCDAVNIVTNITQQDQHVTGFFPSFMS
jgi:hypothetical protein